MTGPSDRDRWWAAAVLAAIAINVAVVAGAVFVAVHFISKWW